MDRVLVELAEALRAAGLPVVPAQVVGMGRAVTALGARRRRDLKAALRATVALRAEDVPVFDEAFDAFFATDGAPSMGPVGASTAERVPRDDVGEASSSPAAGPPAGRGGGAGPPNGARTLADALAGGAGPTEAALRALARARRPIASPIQVGGEAQRLLASVGGADAVARAAGDRVARLRADGDGTAADALVRRVEDLGATVRDFLRRDLERRRPRRVARFREARLRSTAFRSLRPAEVEAVAREVRRLADRLARSAKARRRRRDRGRLDGPRTIRLAARTGGVPFRPVWRRPRRERPTLVVLCDVSESVREAVRFFLVLALALREAYRGTRVFFFASDLREGTALVERRGVDALLERGRGDLGVGHRTDYGASLRRFASEHLPSLRGRPTVVVLGDARNNGGDPGVDALDAIRTRAERLWWLDPEPPSSWGVGDSEMPTYAPRCDVVASVGDVDALEAAVRRLLREALA